jgi:Flp pilus assembly protein TadG
MRGRLHVRRRRGAEEGATAVEFALVAPVLIGLIMGLVELGRLAWTFHALQHAVQETARHAMVHDADALPALTAFLQSQVPGGGEDVTLTLDEVLEDGALYVTIRADLLFRPVAGFLPIGPIVLPARARVPRLPGF